ncbi:MAG TPA: hypothetical protein VJP76_01420 [Candidatus Tumulicola sp.]|nr:hypothetical protein [Candidatus Tumulicola sp.]
MATAVALEAVVALVWHVRGGLQLDEFVATPILTTLVYTVAAFDVRPPTGPDGERPRSFSLWERFLERSWAVIVIDFLLSYVLTLGLAGTASTDLAEMFGGIAIVTASAMLVFADASATADDDLTPLLVLPRAFARSVAAVWQPAVFPRAFALLALQLAVVALQSAAGALLLQAHVPNADFWAQIPLLDVAVVPLSALTMLVYLDAAATRRATA